MTNRLSEATSPYLRQHAENPVDWYPWGGEALERSKREQRPILLSIGYAACHWCHVMAHESFENAETARLMNERFVNIKVDREERPDLDSVYMQAVQALTGQGGWPMTVFLTPDGVPFHAGTYFPPEDRPGLPSFRRVLRAVSDAYQTTPERVASTTASMLSFYRGMEAPAPGVGVLTPHTLETAYRTLAQQFDMRNGGFGGAPKFPPTMALDFLLRYWRRHRVPWALDMVSRTFQAMSRGGIYDQIGGGFARYSVDARWLVPHFEKMLYDNALLIRLGTHVYQATKAPEVRRIVEETVAWVGREMRAPEGGFYSSLDADSEGEEGRFYVWGLEEITLGLRGEGGGQRGLDTAGGGGVDGEIGAQTGHSNSTHAEGAEAAEAAGAAGAAGATGATGAAGAAEAAEAAEAAKSEAIVIAYFGVTTEGNFEGHNILRVPEDTSVVAARAGVSVERVESAVAHAKRVLYDARALRVWPGLDDKVVTSWNGLMVCGIAEAARALDRPDVGEMAVTAGEFLFRRLVSEGPGDEHAVRVARSFARGTTGTWGFLEDYGSVALAAIALYELTFDARWLERARAVAQAMTRWFWDETAGAFFDTAHDAEPLVTRPRDVADNAMPSGTSLAADALLRLAELTGDAEMRRLASRVLETLAESMGRMPTGFGHLLGVADMAVFGAVEVALAGHPASGDFTALVREVGAHYVPSLVFAGGQPGITSGVALLDGRAMIAGAATAYVCRGYACELPVTEPAQLGEQLERAGEIA